MKKLYRFGAATFAVLAGLAAIGAGALVVATAVVIGALMALAGKLAVRSFDVNLQASDIKDDHGMGEKATA